MPDPQPDSTLTRPSYLPERLHTVTPYLCCKDARQAITWYGEVFGAIPLGEPIVMDDGRLGHAEIRIGDSAMMLADEFPEIDVLSPLSRGGTPVSLMIYVEDVDSLFAKAIEKGATQERPVVDEDHGDRSGWLVDPFGHRWNVATPL